MSPIDFWQQVATWALFAGAAASIAALIAWFRLRFLGE
jgi:hypothetical protein